MPYKTCLCGAQNGVRAKVCSNCSKPFEVKTNPINKLKKIRQAKTEKVDWRELLPGDRIKVLQGSGPYYITKDKDKIFMNVVGKFTVVKLEKDGIWASGKEGIEFIYMGPKKIGRTGTTMVKHKIRKIK